MYCTFLYTQFVRVVVLSTSEMDTAKAATDSCIHFVEKHDGEHIDA